MNIYKPSLRGSHQVKDQTLVLIFESYLSSCVARNYLNNLKIFFKGGKGVLTPKTLVNTPLYLSIIKVTESNTLGKKVILLLSLERIFSTRLKFQSQLKIMNDLN
jgi:hypothetical protein